MEMTFDAKIENLDQVLAFVDGHLESIDCPIKAQMHLDVAVEELFVNVASYAYQPLSGKVRLQISTDEEPQSVIIRFFDRGVPFDPTKKPDPDTTLSAEERQIGGLGIYMVKKNVDSFTYEYREGQNVLTIKKNL